jgi:hypothetical protein
MALQMLIGQEQLEAAEEDSRELRRALLATGVPLDVLFPEVVRDAPPSEELIEEALQSEGPVEWVSTATGEEAYEVLEKLGLMKGEGELTGDDLFIDPRLLEETDEGRG